MKTVSVKTFDDVPDWITKEVLAASTAYGLHPAWYISIAMSEKPHGNDNHDAAVYCEPEYMRAGLEIRADVKEKDGGKQIIWHEIAHVFLSPLVHTAYNAFDQLHEGSTRELAKKLLDDVEEQTIQQLVYGVIGK